MGTGKHLMISATGFPGTNKTWRFIQSAFREPLEAFAKVAGDKTILAGLTQTTIAGAVTVSDGYVSFQNEVLPFVGGSIGESVTLIEEIEYVNYDVDIDNDGVQDSLPGYKTKYLRFGTDGIVSFPFSDLTRLKSIKELSLFNLPPNLVTDPNYVHTDHNFTLALLEKLNSVQFGAEQNVQADWNMSTPASDAFIRNKPFSDIMFTHGSLTVQNFTPGNWANDFTKNYIYVPPPNGYTIQQLMGFIPSICQIDFAGDVDANDSIWCKYQIQLSNGRAVAICGNSEMRTAPRINFLAIWKK